MRRPEASPLYVWLTIGLMTTGAAVYIISYFLTEEKRQVLNGVRYRKNQRTIWRTEGFSKLA
jgi:heme exporter protein D